ncbi:MAG: glycosyltransferase family 2 protein [Magnetococcales bacterium]|nr:glycosyltransferase family 2 protein [Magnetococcales bacterium]
MEPSIPTSPRHAGAGMVTLQLVVVIPCHDEPDLLVTLDSLWRCRPAACLVEVVVVINGSETDPDAVRQRNWQTWVAARDWMAAHQGDDRQFYLLHEPSLPARQAGVGTARKTGMDWAATRFAGRWRTEGVIVCLDADCVVADNYLEALQTHFAAHPDSPGCAIYFEHPWETLSPAHRQAIIRYELYLRYYLHGLRWSGFPHAFHTVGSSMAVRADPYRRQGGMNRRKAGEDFYFLQKIIPLGHFSDLCTTTVFPSARLSHRVPFGTGRAMSDGLAGSRDLGLVFAPALFAALGLLFSRLEQLHVETVFAGLPPSLHRFLTIQQWPERLAELRANTATLSAFRKRFFQTFNGFQILKYIHFAMDQGERQMAVAEAAALLLERMGLQHDGVEEEQVLLYYRRLDRQGYWYGEGKPDGCALF